MTREAPPTFVSVVMPVRNEAGFIARSLGAVLAQDHPSDRMEVLVVDGMSTDGTRARVEQIATASDVPVRLLDNPGLVAPCALNEGLAAATGEVVVRVDGHCEVAADYVRRCLEVLERTGADGVGGPLETIGETLVARAIAAAMSSRFGVGDSGFRTGTDEERDVDTVAFPAYPRQVLERAGPFDEELVRNQDDEYNYRIRETGGRIVLSPEVRARYFSRSSLRSVWRQYLQYGFWKVRVMQKHPWQMRPRQLVPPLFVGMLLTLAALGVVWPLAWMMLLGVGVLYCGATVLASLSVAARKGMELLPVLPLVFAVLHVSYGLGFLGGTLRFWNRWGDRGTAPSRAPAGDAG